MDHSILELMGLPRIYLVDELTQASPTINKLELLNVDMISINIVARKQTWIFFGTNLLLLFLTNIDIQLYPLLVKNFF
jgi:hypothetical protein